MRMLSCTQDFINIHRLQVKIAIAGQIAEIAKVIVVVLGRSLLGSRLLGSHLLLGSLLLFLLFFLLRVITEGSQIKVAINSNGTALYRMKGRDRSLY